jgi:hypothetical protein
MKLIELLWLRVASSRMEEMIFLNLPARLARLLLRLLKENAAAADKNNLSITRQDISRTPGATRGERQQAGFANHRLAFRVASSLAMTLNGRHHHQRAALTGMPLARDRH